MINTGDRVQVRATSQKGVVIEMRKCDYGNPIAVVLFERPEGTSSGRGVVTSLSDRFLVNQLIPIR